MPCTQCKKTVSDSDRIVCHGYCGAEFHMICAKVDLPLLDQLGQYDGNLFWMCNECAKLFQNSHFRRIDDENRSTIKSMQDDITKLSETVSKLLNSAPPGTPSWTTQERPRIGAKRRLMPASKPAPSLPQSSQGRKVLSVPVPVVSSTLSVDKCWIWLGSFSPKFTESDICAMVKECLSCDEGDMIEACALVKKGVDVGGLRSVTFKVGVDKRFREAAMDANNWPAGVSFREFVDFGKPTSNSTDDPESGFPKTARTSSPTA